MISKNRFSSIALRMIIVGSLSSVGLLFSTPTANAASPDWAYAESCSDGNCWEWGNFSDLGINELEIYNVLDDDSWTNDDGYDGFGGASINGDYFDWDLIEAELFDDDVLVGNEFIIPGTDGDGTAGSTYTVTFSRNNVTFLIQSPNEANIVIGGEMNDDNGGDLGSDDETVYFTLGSHFISYAADPETGLPFNDGSFIQDNGNVTPRNFDPIFMWETNGVITENVNPGIDSVTITGGMLQLIHYAYAYDPEGFLNSDAFFTNFLKFIDEDKTRMDVFTVDWIPTATAAAPAPVYVRQTSNLTFAQSLYASDKLYDPDGELRKTVDQIMAKYGSLIQ